MNGLYGYPSGPSTMSNMGVMSADPTAEATLTDVVSGKAYEELLKLQRQQQSLNGDIAAKSLAISNMADGPAKTKAKELWENANKQNKEAYTNLRQSIDKYNEVAREVRTFSLGLVAPKMLSGMGVPPAIVAGFIAAAPWIVATLLALAGLIFATRANLSSGRGYLDQAAGLVAETGATIGKTAFAVVAIVAAYIGLKLFQERPRARSSRPAGALPMPKEVTLKPVSGEVVS